MASPYYHASKLADLIDFYRDGERAAFAEVQRLSVGRRGKRYHAAVEERDRCRAVGDYLQYVYEGRKVPCDTSKQGAGLKYDIEVHL